MSKARHLLASLRFSFGFWHSINPIAKSLHGVAAGAGRTPVKHGAQHTLCDDSSGDPFQIIEGIIFDFDTPLVCARLVLESDPGAQPML